ncbi:TRAP transporter large permease [Chloroflexota bacterium]
MSPEAIGAVGIGVLLVLMYMRMWTGAAMLFVGFWGIVAIMGFSVGMGVIGIVPFRAVAFYTFAAVPMFVLMAVIVSNTGVGADLYYTAYKWFGHLRGGLATATVVACAGFAAITGTSTAAVVTMGKVALPEMKKYNYDEGLAAGSIAAGSTIGVLIPPSMAFILYGILTETSIGKLFMAGIIPGITEAIFYIITIYLLCRFKPSMGPPGPKTGMKEKVISLKDTWPVVALFVLVIGGIYMGIFTPTEAGAIGAFGAIAITFAYKRLKKDNFMAAVLETAQLTAMMVFMVAGAFVFMQLMNLSKLPFALSNFITELPFSRYWILVAIIFVYIILGMFLHVISVILVTVPIFFPVIIGLGFDPVWYGVIMVRVSELGLITPPVGMQVFILSGITGTPIGTIFRGIIPFAIADVLHIALLVAIPQLSLFIPNNM